MMEFRLKVGDIVRTPMSEYSVSKITKAFVYLGQFNKYSKVIVDGWLSAPGVSFHRPTPDGLVQVWPEANNAS